MGLHDDARLWPIQEKLAANLGITPLPPFQGPRWHFRDKIKLAVSGSLENPILGLLLTDLQTGVELLDCPVQAEALNHELPGLIDFITKWKLVPYQAVTKKGELKGLILSWSPTTGEKMLRFVLRSKEALDRIRLGLSELSQFTVVSVNLQPIPHAILEGPEEIILSEKSFITHLSADVQLMYSPQSFMQTNSVVATQLYQTATEWLLPWCGQKALDLYCGVGGFALHMAHAGLTVRGVEINASAVKIAQQAALLNNLAVDFMAQDAAEIEALWQQWQPQVVLVNPPRRGLARGVETILRHLPPVLLYSSCSPESFALDWESLQHHYVAKRTKVFDMFPHTNHFEVLTLMVLR